MLIVAIPKSASTSLLYTIWKIHGLNVDQDISFKDKEVPQGVAYLHRIHSDVREIDELLENRFKKGDTIFKQHIYPSINNLHNLKGIKVVVLLRSSEEIIRRNCIKFKNLSRKVKY